MQWIDAILDQRTRPEYWAYRADGPPSMEPASLAAMALAVHGRQETAQRAGQWLVEQQNEDGSFGVSVEHREPGWPTAMAVLAWLAIDRAAGHSPKDSKFAASRDRAVRWILAVQGKPVPRHVDIGHDTTLLGWPWVQGTHSWLEPTAWCLLALKAAGHGDHPRAREAARLLIDRMLPEGGCNYGNTSVLGQWLRPQVAPTGVALLALAGEHDSDVRLQKSLDYTADSVGPGTTAISLAYGLLGLNAHGRTLQGADAWLQGAAQATAHHGATLPRQTLLTLAATGIDCPLIELVTAQTATSKTSG